MILMPNQWKCWLSPQTSLELAYDVIALYRQDYKTRPVTTGVGSP